MTAQSAADLLIVLTESDPSDVFSPDADMAGVDAEASAEAYDNLLASILEHRFPGATVEFGPRAMISQDDDGVIAQTIAAVVDGPMQDRQSDWIVMA